MKRLPLALLGLVLLATPATAPAAKKDRCRAAKDGVTLRKTSRVLVYQREGNVIACLRPNGQRHILGYDDGLYNMLSIDSIRGTKVTYSEDYIPECKADCPPNVTGGTTTSTIDLRTGETT